MRLVLEEGRTINAVAKSLGICSSSLSDWVKQAEIDRGKGPPGALKSEEIEELRRLRRKTAS